MSRKKSRIKYRSIAVHRAVAETMLGRKLLPSEVVHHIDGNGLNNSVDNLVVMSASDHTKLHHAKREKYIKTGVNDLIVKAINLVGGQATLADLCRVSQAAVSKWANGKPITVENALAVEKATQGVVTARELRPDAMWPESSNV